jgi:signal transduction histidine kinase/ActR/RegA family two-component response regulator
MWLVNNRTDEMKQNEHRLRELHDESEMINQQLRNEMKMKASAEEALKKARDEFEIKVQERTKKLAATNKQLNTEIIERQLIEDALLEKQAALRSQNIDVVRKSIELSDIKRQLEDKNYDLKLSAGELEKTIAEVHKARDELQIEEALLVAKKAAEAASQAKSNFLANMSHEIRTPMNAVVGFTEMLMDTSLNDEQLEHAKILKRSGDGLLVLIDDILDFSRIEAGQLVLETVEFAPQATAHQVCDLIRPSVANKPIEVLCRIGDEVPANVRGDPARFKQVLVNLMGNAAKFTEAGEIELVMDIRGHKNSRVGLQAIVRDTGIGISKRQTDTIFEVFHQADTSSTRKYGGTGLGLPICKRIAKILDGDVWVESQLGKGSTFYFTAWFEEAEHKKREEELVVTQHDLRASSRKSARILLAEDNPVNQRLAKLMLTKAGYQVEVADNGKEAIEKIMSFPEGYDLIFMDVQMPQMDGPKATRTLREKGFDKIPIVAMTAHAMKGDRERCLQAGMDDYITKPIKRKSVLAMVQKWLHYKDAS